MAMWKKKNAQKAANRAEQEPAAKKAMDKTSLRFVIPMVLFFLVVGVLLIWMESQVTRIASCIIAALLIVYGGWLLVRYFRSPAEKRIAGFDLAMGLILVLIGALLAFNPNALDALLPSIWGLSMVFGGFLKIQYAFDEKSVKVSRWWIMLAFAAVSLIIGILTLLRAFIFGAENQHLFIGIFMLAEAVLDIVTYIVIRLGMKKLAEQKDTEKDEMYNTALEAAETAALEAVKTAALNAAQAVETPESGEGAE